MLDKNVVFYYLSKHRSFCKIKWTTNKSKNTKLDNSKFFRF